MKFYSQIAGCDALDLLHHQRGAIRGPHPYKEMNVIGLNRQRKDRPPLFFALLFNDLPGTLGDLTRQHWLAAAWTPDEMIDDEMHTVLITLVLKLVCILHSLLYTVFYRFARVDTAEKPA